MNAVERQPTQPALVPVRIGHETARNRIGLAPLHTGLVSAHGIPTEKFEEFHDFYASMQLGIVFIGGVAVSPSGRTSARSATLHTSEAASAIAASVRRIRARGAVPIIQLMHAGRQANPREIGSRIVAPSAIPCPVVGFTPDEVTRADIRQIIDAFVTSAALAKDAGASIIELHAAHGYLLAGFLSPYSNKRTDEYGSTAHGRRRLLIEILRETATIENIHVGVRISGDEHVAGGLTASDMPDTIRALEGAGACYVSIAAGVYASDDRIMPPRSLGEAVNASLGKVAKSSTTLPILLAGNITTLQSANELIRTDSADVLLMGRSLLADPYLLPKSLTSEAASIQPCTMSTLCKYHSRGFPHIACPHNQLLSGWLRSSIRASRL